MSVDRLQTLVASGQFLAAFREAERLGMDPTLDHVDRAKALVAGVRAAAGLREVYAGAKMAEKAVEFAELSDDWNEIGNARLHAALIHRELGDTSQALRFFDLFLQYLDRYPIMQTKTAHAYYNKGLTHQQRREFSEALEAYRLAAEDFEKLGNMAGVVASIQNSAWVLLLQGRPADAEPYMARSQMICSHLDQPEYQVSQLVLEAVAAKLIGDPDGAMSLCEEVFQSGRQGVSDRHLAAASWVMAEVSLEARRLHEAGIFADLATSYALQAREPHLMNLAGEVRQRVLSKKSELRA